MAKLITKFKYIKPGNGAGSYLKYIATREGVEKIDDSKKLLPTTAKQKILIAKLLRDFPDSREMLEYEDYRAEKTIGAASEFITRAIEDNAHSMMTSKTYADYIATRPRAERFGSHGLFTDDGVEIKLTEVSEELNRHEGNVWTAIVSLRREDAERLGYNDAESWRELVCACAPEIARGYKIPLEHLRWYAAFHRKEDSVHIHMVVFSSDPKEGYLTKQGIRQVKSAFGRRIFQQDLIHIYEQKTEHRDTLSRDAERAMAELIVQMETAQLHNERLEQLVVELAQRLHNTQGKKVYGYLPPKTKALVDAIVDELAKDECVAAAYDLWNQMREEVCRTYSEQLLERLPLSQQKEFKAVRNMVIREVLKLGQSEHPTADELVHIPTPLGTPPAPSNVPHRVHHPQQEAAHHQQTQTHQAASHVDAARCVLQLFYNMGRIFQDQSAADTIQAGLHVDRKRRRMLREKRMALGHKADDHEDAVSIQTPR